MGDIHPSVELDGSLDTLPVFISVKKGKRDTFVHLRQLEGQLRDFGLTYQREPAVLGVTVQLSSDQIREVATYSYVGRIYQFPVDFPPKPL